MVERLTFLILCIYLKVGTGAKKKELMDKIKSGLKQHTKGGSNSSSAEIKSTHAESTGQKLIRVTGLKDKNEEVKKK